MNTHTLTHDTKAYIENKVLIELNSKKYKNKLVPFHFYSVLSSHLIEFYSLAFSIAGNFYLFGIIK